MDSKTPEIDLNELLVQQQKQRIGEISKNWIFPEKQIVDNHRPPEKGYFYFGYNIHDFSSLEILQVDQSQRFLALRTGTDLLGDKPQQHTSEYFFDPAGNIYASEKEEYKKGTDDLDYSEIHLKGDINIRFKLDKKDNLSITFEHDYEDEDENFFYNTAYVSYKEGNLSKVSLGNSFEVKRHKDEDHVETSSPAVVVIQKKEGSQGKSSSDWVYDLDSGTNKDSSEFKAVPSDQDNILLFSNKNGEIMYKVSLELKDDNKLVLTQEHMPSGKLKRLTAPLSIDFDQVCETFFTAHPYPKKPSLVRGLPPTLEVPWRNIDRIVGASLGYTKVGTEA